MERSSVCSVASERYEGIMKKFFLLSVILYAFLSCKKGEGNQEVEFINNDFKVVLDSFILDAKIYSIQQYNDILISLDEENNDTILSFENANPFELENLKGVFTYNDFTLYFYTSDSLNHKLKTFIKTNNDYLDISGFRTNEMEKINIMETPPIYSHSYLINENKIKFIKLPLVWSTDSIR